KQVLTIPGGSSDSAPAPQAPAEAEAATTADGSTATTNGVPADVDELAMSLLADESRPAAPVEQPKTFTTTCPYCDEEVQFDVALAGKQAPCPNPECRRIIKVPPLTKQEKVDWRGTASGLPSAARRPTEPAPEGAWGSTHKSYVSKEALEEAQALPSQQREPLTKSQWAVRILLASAGVGLVVAGTLGELSSDADAQAEGLRRVSRKLIEKGQAVLAEQLAQQLSDGSGALAVVGLEFQRAGEEERVKKLLKQITDQVIAARPKRN